MDKVVGYCQICDIPMVYRKRICIACEVAQLREDNKILSEEHTITHMIGFESGKKFKGWISSNSNPGFEVKGSEEYVVVLPLKGIPKIMARAEFNKSPDKFLGYIPLPPRPEEEEDPS